MGFRCLQAARSQQHGLSGGKANLAFACLHNSSVLEKREKERDMASIILNGYLDSCDLFRTPDFLETLTSQHVGIQAPRMAGGGTDQVASPVGPLDVHAGPAA